MAVSRVNHLPGAVMAAGLALGLLSGCGQPRVAPAQEASAPAVRPDALAGAPSDAPGPPPAAEQPPPPPIAPPPPERPADRPGDREVIYDLGPVVRAHDTMAPIPNPPETRPMGRRRPATRPHAARAHRAPIHGHAVRSHGARGRSHAAASAHGASTAPVRRPAKAGPGTKPASAVKPASTVAPSKSSSKPSSTSKPHDAAKPASATSAERAQQLTALQGSLRDAVGRSAVLNAPELKAGQPAEVTLTLPADFASVVRDEAGKQKLADAAASVNMTALLAGDGYAVAPDETQSQPLTIGQPTEFHWTVTAQPGAHGPLHADVGADLLGGGDSALQLGSVSPSGGGLHISPRVWGVALLVLLAAIVIAWLNRGGRGGVRRGPRSVTRGAYDRPLDMGTSAPPPTDRDL